MKYFQVLHLGAGCFPQGSVVSEDDIRSRQFNLEHWLAVKAVAEVEDPNPPAKVEQKQPDPGPPAVKSDQTQPAAGAK